MNMQQSLVSMEEEELQDAINSAFVSITLPMMRYGIDTGKIVLSKKKVIMNTLPL